MNDELLNAYCADVPDFLAEAARTPELLKLRGVGMNCGCEYTAFPRFATLEPYTRWEHSLGVGLITWRFTRDAKQALAALFHDIATPCFAHVIDFLNGDHLTQESTEDGTAGIIDGSAAIQRTLRALGLTTRDVRDYHAYPIADNDTPRLSADRLEYTLGNTVNYGFGTIGDVRRAIGDLAAGTGEDGMPELAFRTPDVARRFCECALACSRIYVSDPDRYSMQALAELLGDALAAGVITRADLMGTEPEVVAKLTADAAFARRWRGYRAMNATRRAGAGEDCPPGDGWRVVPAKRRWIDPLVNGVRATALFPDFARAVEAFLNEPQDVPVMGFAETGNGDREGR